MGLSSKVRSQLFSESEKQLMSFKPNFRRTKSFWPLDTWTQRLPLFPESSSSADKVYVDFICLFKTPLVLNAWLTLAHLLQVSLEMLHSLGRLLCVGSPHDIHYVSTACLVEPISHLPPLLWVILPETRFLFVVVPVSSRQLHLTFINFKNNIAF